MPIIKSAKKRVKQSEKAYIRNKHYNTRMRTMVKNVLKETDAEKAEKSLPEIYSAVDVALKKKLLHKNNAARKKATAAKRVAFLKAGGATTKVETKKKNVNKVTKAKAVAAKKTAKKATAKK